MVVLQDGHKRNHIKNYRNYTHSRHAKVPPAHFAQVVATWRAVIDENATKWSKSKLSSCLTTCKPPTSHCRTIQNTEVRFVGHDLGHIVNLVSSFSIVQRKLSKIVVRPICCMAGIMAGALKRHLHVPLWMPQRPHIVLTYQPPSSFHLLLVTSTTPNNGIEDSIENSLQSELKKDHWVQANVHSHKIKMPTSKKLLALGSAHWIK